MSDPNKELDIAVGKQLNTPAEAVRNARLQWNESQVMRAVFMHRFTRKMTEIKKALETVKTEELTAKQSELLAYKVALTFITTKEE